MSVSPEVANHAVAASSAPRLLPLAAVLDRVGVSKSSLYGMIRAGNFARPTKLGRCARWLESDVNAAVLRIAQAGKLPPPTRARAAA